MDTDYGPSTNHANDPRNDVGALTDLCDIAHQRIVTRLAEGDSVCKVIAEDIFSALIERNHPKAVDLLTRLFQLAYLSGEHGRDATEELVRDARQVVDDFVECHDNLRDSMIDELEQEQREEDMREAEANYIMGQV